MISSGKIKIQRRISESVAHKLNYDYLCYRGSVMNESYLNAIISEVVVACVDQHNYRVKCNFPHPALYKKGKGRKPEVDYAIQKLGTSDVGFVVEAKWAGSSYCTSESILRDLVRLKVVKNWSGKKCSTFFMLAGRTFDICNIFKEDLFGHGKKSPLFLESNRTSYFELKGNHGGSKVICDVVEYFEKYSSLNIPEGFKCKLASNALISKKEARFSAFIWEVF